MPQSPAWYRIASDPAVLRRAVGTSVVVGTVLTVANHADELVGGAIPTGSLLPIAVTYLVPFVVSCASSVLAVRVERGQSSAGVELLEREIQAINQFPGQNPNPVMRMTEDGLLTYANEASAPVLAGLGIEVGGTLPAEQMTAFREAAAASHGGDAAQDSARAERVEVVFKRRTFAVLPVHVPELGVYNLYGTDITAAKVVEHFPDRNPNPVLRMTPEGRLWYANAASAGITTALGASIGDPLPAELLARLRASLADPTAPDPEVGGEGGRTWRIKPVEIPEFDFVNLYGTDITAERAIDKFPNQNPNPVLRLSRQGVLTYANPASALVRTALGAEVGDALDPAVFARVLAARESAVSNTIELEADGRLFRVLVVLISEFDSINLYGTDITAARQVEELSAANERLLLNILPASIAERLRAGESVIADRFDDMAVLFADVVGFTELSARMAPNEVVSVLNDVFTMCDRLADRFGLEKIKTIGDAYMVVGGLPGADGTRGTGGLPGVGGVPSDAGVEGRRPTHAEDVADMGLAMLEELASYGARTGIPLEMRAGIHVGPAVAGVIGLKKFIYDVWGDTVNTASRMESTGVPGRVQVTRETRDRLAASFECEARGPVEVKGKGRVEAWLLVGRRTSAG